MELIKKYKKRNFYIYYIMHIICTTYKPSGPRVNWSTVNTHNIIYVISYCDLVLPPSRRRRVNRRGCVQLSLFSPAAADRETARAYHPTFRRRRFMRNNNIKRLTALQKRKTSCSHTRTHTHFYSSFNGIDFVLVASNDSLCTRARHNIINIIIIVVYECSSM